MKEKVRRYATPGYRMPLHPWQIYGKQAWIEKLKRGRHGQDPWRGNKTKS